MENLFRLYLSHFYFLGFLFAILTWLANLLVLADDALVEVLLYSTFDNDLAANWTCWWQPVLWSLLLIVLLVFVDPHVNAFCVEHVVVVAGKHTYLAWSHQVRYTDRTLLLFHQFKRSLILLEATQMSLLKSPEHTLLLRDK